MKLFLCALALMLILEGIPYLALPRQLQDLFAWMLTRSQRRLRTIGLSMILAGLLLLWAVRTYFG